jgi:serine protease AprX
VEVLLRTLIGESRRIVASVVVVFCAVVLVSGAPRPEPPSSKRDTLLQSPESRWVRVIVTTRPGATLRVEKKLRHRGRRVSSRFVLLDAVAARVRVEDLASLEADPDVIRISADTRVIGHAVTSDAGAAAAITSAAALGSAGSGWTGAGVGIAVIDSGLKRNGDFTRLEFYDFTARARDADDEYGHGTHISGLIGSKGTLSKGAYAGVAPNARIVSLRVLDSRGQGFTSDVIAAIEFAVVNRQALGVDVLNLSLGHPIFEPAATDPLVRAVEAAVEAGIVVVVSAGNVGRSLENGIPGYAGILSPANAPSAITVGALDTMNTARFEDDFVAAYSSRGPTWYDGHAKPDVVAPGHNLVSDAAVDSTLYVQHPERRIALSGSERARFFRMSGTSMAAGVTSGVVALLIEAGRSVTGSAPTPDTVKQILAYSALPLTGVDRLTQGHGAVNAAGALDLLLAVASSAGAPVEEAASQIVRATTIEGVSWPWNQATVLDQAMVWGNVELWASAVVWGSAMVWGNDDAMVWGNEDAMVWGNDDAMVWGNLDDAMVWGNNDDAMVWGNEDAMVWGNTGVWGNTDDSR